MTKTCPYCQKEFTPTGRNQKYCSPACWKAAKQGREHVIKQPLQMTDDHAQPDCGKCVWSRDCGDKQGRRIYTCGRAGRRCFIHDGFSRKG